MGLCIENTPDGIIARLSGELDHHSSRNIREQIDSAVEKAKPAKLILDFGEVGFMDSSGVGLIMGRYRLMQLYGGDLLVTGASERIKKVISLAGLEKLNIFADMKGVNAGKSR
jgi:stage II sporulation protein AA (anti-sigma F factor antagonist)